MSENKLINDALDSLNSDTPDYFLAQKALTFLNRKVVRQNTEIKSLKKLYRSRLDRNMEIDEIKLRQLSLDLQEAYFSDPRIKNDATSSQIHPDWDRLAHCVFSKAESKQTN